ncbi:MAG: PKD domain-containing protein [Bacteroidetes bacterium]|nr:PKD domain-containing protein [Bacteroidota bacterium]
MKKILLTVFLIYIALISQQANGQNASWSAIAPTYFPTNVSGQIHGISRVSQMKFHPSNSQKMYAVSARGGLFTTSDGGANWTVAPGTDFMPYARLASVCVDYTNDQVIYLGTGDHNYYYTGSGVWKSTNGGTTFVQQTMGNFLVVEMIMDPVDHNVIVAATSSGIYKTLNGGTTWTLKTAARTFDDLKQKTPSSRTLYATTTDSAFFRSADFGDTWMQINSGIVLPAGFTSGNGCRVAVTPADTNVVYLGMVVNGGTIYKSTNGGTSFSAIKTAASPYLTYYSNVSTSSSQGDYNFAIGADRANANILYLVAHNVWKSTDGGVNWTQMTNWWLQVHTDMHQVITSPYDNSKLYNMNDGGVWLSTDGGTNWTPKSDGLYGYEIYHGNCSPKRKDMISIGTQDNGELYYANTGTGWFCNRGGDWGSQCDFDYRTNSSMVYYYGNNKRRLVNGSDATYNLPAAVTLLQGLAFHRSNPDLAFVGDTSVYRTTNLSAASPTWTSIVNLNKKIMAMHSSFADANVLYVITSDGFIYVSANALSATPTFTSYALPSASSSTATITTIASASNIVYITINNKVYRSSSSGSSWTNITYNLPSVNHVKILADEYFPVNELVFVASNNTVYYKTGSMVTWNLYNANLPSRPTVTDLSIFNDGTSNSALRVAIYGRGMWETSITNLRSLTALFTADNTAPCAGTPVHFTDNSTGSVTSWSWSFPGGTPSTSNVQNPVVTYASTGSYHVTLTVGDGTGTNTITKTSYINVSAQSLPVTEGFESGFPPANWTNYDAGANGVAWSLKTGTGGYGLSSNCVYFNNWSYNVSGLQDEFYTRTYDLNGYATAQLSFDLAYWKYSNLSESDTLEVLISTDCGNTYSRIYYKGSYELSTVPGLSSSAFTPTSTQWRTDTVSLNAYIGNVAIIKFRNRGYYGNNIYIDNLNITGVTQVTLNLKMFIEGFYAGSRMMRPVLFDNSLSGDPAASDSVTVELHSTTSPYALVATKRVLLHSNGNATVLFPYSIMNHSYFVAILHRNSLETWSKNPVLFNSSAVSLDLTTQ